MANDKNQPTQPDLADLIAETLAHPDLPYVIREGILDGICSLNSSTEMYENAEVLREIFKCNVPRRKGGR